MPTYVFYAYDEDGKDHILLRFTPPDTWGGKREIVERWKKNLASYMAPGEGRINLIKNHKRIPELVFHQRVWAEVEKPINLDQKRAQEVLEALWRE